MRKRCIWTGERSDDLVPVSVTTLNRFGTRPREETFYVQPQYEAAFRDFQADFVRHAGTFLKGLVLFMLAVLLTSALMLAGLLGEDLGLVLMGVVTAALGAGVYRFPFATPETVAMFGLRRSIRFARAAGVLTVITGVATMLLSLMR